MATAALFEPFASDCLVRAVSLQDLGAAQTFNNSSPNFNLYGNITLAGFNLTLDAGDAGDAINMNGAISGTGNVTKIGTGIGRFEGSSANTFTGTTTVGAGELRLLKNDGGSRRCRTTSR